METFNLQIDIPVICVQASTFPEGIMAAHEKLHGLLPSMDGRGYFGLSYMDKNGGIIYKAAAEEKYPGEAQKLHCESYTISKGDYLSIYIKDFLKDPFSIQRAFENLTSDPRIDPQGIAVEMYLTLQDVRCMVKVKV